MYRDVILVSSSDLQCQGYHVKQGIDPDGARAIAHEAFIYQLLERSCAQSGMLRYLPGFRHFDTQRYILIVDLVENAEDYFGSRKYPRLSTQLAAQAGRALAILHSARIHPEVSANELRSMMPSVFDLHAPSVGFYRRLSLAGLELLRILQRTPQFPDFLDGLRRSWSPCSLIHNDVKADNLIVTRPARAKPRPQLVDWEMSALGDPCWDIGAMFAMHLSLWTAGIPFLSGDELRLDLSRVPLEAVQPSQRALWGSYTRHYDSGDKRTASERLVTAVKYASARLVHLAFEQTQRSAVVPGQVLYMLQLAVNMALRTEEAIVHLLGLSLEGQ